MGSVRYDATTTDNLGEIVQFHLRLLPGIGLNTVEPLATSVCLGDTIIAREDLRLIGYCSCLPYEKLPGERRFVVAAIGSDLDIELPADVAGAKVIGLYPNSLSAESIEISESGYHIVSFLVDPDRRREGIGTTLLEECLAHVKTRNARAILADCWTIGESAAINERLGFEKIVKVASSYFDGSDTVLFGML